MFLKAKNFQHILYEEVGEQSSEWSNNDSSKGTYHKGQAAKVQAHPCSLARAIAVRTQNIIQPPHNKTNQMISVPSKDSDQPGHQPSLISLHCVLSRLSRTQCFFMQTTKGMPRLSETSLGAQVILLVLSCGGSYGATDAHFNPHLLVDLSILTNWTSPFPILGVSGVLFHFYSFSNRYSC